MTTKTIDWIARLYHIAEDDSATPVDTNAAFRELRFQSTAKTDNSKPSSLQALYNNLLEIATMLLKNWFEAI